MRLLRGGEGPFVEKCSFFILATQFYFTLTTYTQIRINSSSQNMTTKIHKLKVITRFAKDSRSVPLNVKVCHSV